MEISSLTSVISARSVSVDALRYFVETWNVDVTWTTSQVVQRKIKPSTRGGENRESTAGVDLLQERIPRSAAYDALVDAPAELALTLAAAIIMHTPRHHREIVGCAPAPSHPLDRLLCATVKREAIYLTLLFLASCVALAFTPGKSTQPWPLQSPG